MGLCFKNWHLWIKKKKYQKHLNSHSHKSLQWLEDIRCSSCSDWPNAPTTGSPLPNHQIAKLCCGRGREGDGWTSMSVYADISPSWMLSRRQFGADSDAFALRCSSFGPRGPWTPSVGTKTTSWRSSCQPEVRSVSISRPSRMERWRSNIR